MEFNISSRTGQLDSQDKGTQATESAMHMIEDAQLLFDDNGDDSELHHSSPADVQAMRRMGRKQELVRTFRPLTMTSFVALSTLAWEAMIYAIGQALIDGGRPNAIYSTCWSFIGFIPVYLSLAEMSSMAPIAGSQYHWVSEFAPEKYQKVLSYMTGWISTLAFQAGSASDIFKIGALSQSFITINVPDYTAPRWHATVMTIAFVILALVSNIYGSRALPYWQNTVFLLHVMGFFAVLIPIWIKAPMATHSQVWLEWENLGGWSTQGLAVLVGQMPGVYAHIGVDTACHMAEEIRDAPKVVPRIMMSVFFMNMIFNMFTVLTLCYHIPDIPESLDDITGFPGLWVIRQTVSLPWLNAIFALLLILQAFANLSYLAAVSRDLYAFSRDRGVPYHKWIGAIDKKRLIPTNAYLVSGLIAVAMSIIYLGSPVAFSAIISLFTVALLQCYLFSIGSILWRRIFHPGTLPYAPFSLGRWGLLVNGTAFVFMLWSFFWSFWPEQTPVDASTFNWAVVMFIATILVASVYYVWQGREGYHGPVTLVEGRKTQ